MRLPRFSPRRPAVWLAPAVAIFVVAAGVGCGSSFVSSYVPCSTPQRHFDLKGAQHGPPSLLGVAPARTGSVVFAEGRSGVVYVSRSHGATWQRFGRGVEGVPCSLVSLDPKRPNLMFATNGDQLARTDDAGSHWTTLKLPGSARATGVAIAPSDGRIIYAWGFYGAHGGLTQGPPPGGLFRSSDAGVTWKRIATYEPNAVAVAPSAPGALLVTTEGGFFETTDSGRNWKTLQRDLPHPYGHPDYYDVVAISPTATSRAFVDGQSDRQMGTGPYDGQFTSIVFHTGDGGLDWSPSLRLINAYDIVFAPRSSAVAYVTGDQSNPDHTAATRFHLFRTDDAGQHWIAYRGRVPAPSADQGSAVRPRSSTVQQLFVDPDAPSVLYGETSDGRLARSPNRGKTWTLLPSLPDQPQRSG